MAEERGGWTRLHSLCFKKENYGRETFLWRAERLSEKHGIDCRTNLGNTPLHFACSDPQFADLALFLLEKGADACASNREGETPLHYACIHSTPDVVEAMLRQPNVIVDVCDDTEATPLHWALQQSEFPLGTLRALLSAGARVDSCDEINDTPLHYAAREGLFEIYELLRAASRSPEPYNSLGLTPFHAACETDQAEFVKRFLEKYPHEARRRTSDTLATGLHVAVQAQAYDCVKVLLESDLGAYQMESTDMNAKTPFVWAFLLELGDIITLFEKAGAACDAVTSIHVGCGLPVFGMSDSDSTDNEWDADSWAVLTPVRGLSLALAVGSDRATGSSSDGSELAGALRHHSFEEQSTELWHSMESANCSY